MIDVVVPTVGRPSLTVLLDALAGQSQPLRGRVLLIDDRRGERPPLLPDGVPDGLDVQVLPGPARGPAAARNVGWREATTEWVAFLDDDVVPEVEWHRRLLDDVATAESTPRAVAVQGRIVVPLPADRRPTDWERNVAGLAFARWATADMVVRRPALGLVGGFDEAFPRAYREDADLALRLLGAGGALLVGTRTVAHPVRPAPWWISVRLQAGNADDATMRRRHGGRWRERAGAPRGAFGHHLLATAALLTGVASASAGRRRATGAAVATWAVSTAAFAARRIAPGPRSATEIATMVATSAAIPPVAVWHRAVGELRARRRRPSIQAVLFDRDGTLVHDVAYNSDPERVAPVAGAWTAVERLRDAGLRVGLVSNQSGVARGLLGVDDVHAVNARLGELLGPFDVVEVCPHGPDDGCTCRKPRPGLIQRAAAALGIDPSSCVVIGDIGADVEAALAAGARAVLVPNETTLPSEIAAAQAAPDDRVAVEPDLAAACGRVLAGWR